MKGISIVGGKLDVCSSSNSNSSSVGGGGGSGGGGGNSGGSSSIGQQVSSFISGIFIKHVLDHSPAGLNGTLKTGDRILAVNDIDLTQATHDRAVEVIRNAKSPVKFLIQSLIYINTYTPTCEEEVVSATQHQQQQQQPPQPTITSTKTTGATTTSEMSITTTTTTMTTSSTATVVPLTPGYFDNENEIDENGDLILIDKSKQIIDEPNRYHYNLESLKDKYNYLLPEVSGNGGETTAPISRSRLFIFKLKRAHPNESLGLSLSGNVNLNKTSVFVCAIYKNSIAARHGLIKVGDQILEINGQVIYGRAHSNVTPMIRNMKDLDVYLVILR